MATQIKNEPNQIIKTDVKSNIEPRNFYERILAIRNDLQNLKLNKSGKNTFAGFGYFQLQDFIPAINMLCAKYGVFTRFNLTSENATLDLIDVYGESEKITFETPIAEAPIKGATPIQSLGGIHTYLKRYLYLNAFEIVEPDLLDALSGQINKDKEPVLNEGTYKSKKNAKSKTENANLAQENAEIIDVNVKPKATIDQLTYINALEPRFIEWSLKKFGLKDINDISFEDAKYLIEKIEERKQKENKENE